MISDFGRIMNHLDEFSSDLELITIKEAKELVNLSIREQTLVMELHEAFHNLDQAMPFNYPQNYGDPLCCWMIVRNRLSWRKRKLNEYLRLRDRLEGLHV